MSRSKKKSPYRESRRFDVTCRNHGKCSYCADGRQHKFKRQAHEPEDVCLSQMKAEQRLEEWENSHVIPEDV